MKTITKLFAFFFLFYPQTVFSSHGESSTAEHDRVLLEQWMLNVSPGQKSQTSTFETQSDGLTSRSLGSIQSPVATNIVIEINFIPGKMNSVQKSMFENKLKVFLHEKVDLSSSHSFSIVDVEVISETFTETEDDIIALEVDGLSTLLAEIVVHGQQNVETVSDINTFDELTQEAIQNHEEFLARDVYYLSSKDEYFKHVYEISLSSIEVLKDKEDSPQLPLRSEEENEGAQDSLEESESDDAEEMNENSRNEHSTFELSHVINIIAIAAIGIGVFGLFGLVLSIGYYLRSVTSNGIIKVFSLHFLLDDLKFMFLSTTNIFRFGSHLYRNKMKPVDADDDDETTISSLPSSFSLGSLDIFTAIDENSFKRHEAHVDTNKFEFGSSPLLSKFVRNIHSEKRRHHQIPQEDEEVEIQFENESHTIMKQTISEELFHDEDPMKICYAPPGKLGVAIDTVDGVPVVHKVKIGSPLEGILSHLDRIIAIDDIETVNMSAAEVTKLMISKMDKSRKISYVPKGHNVSSPTP